MSVRFARLARSRFALIPLLATATLGLAACGGDDSATDKVAVSDTDPCAAAVQEGGKLSIYSTMSTDVSPIVWNAFMKAYPKIKVEQTRDSGDELIRRLLTEIKGGKYNADLFEANAQNVDALIAQGVTTPYVVKNAADYPADLHDKNGAWVATRRRTDVIGYNTNLVKDPSELPKTWQDLTDPKYKGKLIVEATDITDFTATRNGMFDGDLAKTKSYWNAINDNDPFFNTGAEETLSLLEAGQRAYYVGAGGQDIVAAQKDGAPVDYVKTEGVMDQSDMVIVKNAPHPNAARCFLEWVTSTDGQKAVVAAHYLPASPAIKTDPAVDPPGMTWWTYLPSYASTYDEDSQAWSDIFGTQ